MMPILHSPGVMTPGQFGPIERGRRCAVTMLVDADHVEHRHAFGDRARSTLMPASTASRIASAVKAGGHEDHRGIRRRSFRRLR